MTKNAARGARTPVAEQGKKIGRDPELKVQVIAYCREQFRSGLGREIAIAQGVPGPVDWQPMPGRAWLRRSGERDRKALKLLTQIETAIAAAVAFCDEAGRDSVAERTLSQLVDSLRDAHPAFLSVALFRQGEGISPVASDIPRALNSYEALIALLDSKNVLGLPANADGSPRFLNSRELALVWLLNGEWPTLQPGAEITPNEVVRKVEKVFGEFIGKMRRKGAPMALGVAGKAPAPPGTHHPRGKR